MDTDTKLLDWLENNGYGYALVSDDAGRWACICDGAQDVSLTMKEEAFDCSTSFWVEKGRWKSSTREAILDAMKEAEDETKETQVEETKQYSSIAVATAMALYSYNVSAVERAKKLYDHFNGDCMEIEELIPILARCKGYEITELPFPTAKVYVEQALEKYGNEANQRVINNQLYVDLILSKSK